MNVRCLPRLISVQGAYRRARDVFNDLRGEVSSAEDGLATPAERRKGAGGKRGAAFPPLHPTITRAAAAFTRRPSGPDHVGGLAVDAVRGVHDQAVTLALVDACGAHVLVEVRDLRRH